MKNFRVQLNILPPDKSIIKAYLLPFKYSIVLLRQEWVRLNQELNVGDNVETQRYPPHQKAM